MCEYYNSSIDLTESKKITYEDTYIVWICKILQNNKALVSVNTEDDAYYEVTFDGDSGKIYVDVYNKIDQIELSPEENKNEQEK